MRDARVAVVLVLAAAVVGIAAAAPSPQTAGDTQATALVAQVGRKRARMEAMAQLFDSLNYKSVLARGYALVRDSAGAPVRRAVSAMSPVA